MVNYPVTQYLAAQHREELLREAERDCLARAATTNSARRTLHELSRQLLTHVQHAAHHQVAAPGGVSPA